MEINEENIRRLVGGIVRELDLSASGLAAAGSTTAAGQDRAGIFTDLDGALRAAVQSHLELMNITLEKRREIVQCMRNTICDNLEELGRMAVEETGMGRVQDKVAKNRVAALSTPGPEDLEPLAYTDDHGLTLVERAPYGVIGAITPSTNPTETIINNAIGMISGGNSVVFNSHPAASRVSAFTITLFNEAIVKCGGPANLICAAASPTLETAQALMKDPRVSLLVVTGGPAVVKAAMSNSKKVIAAGPGNPPCVVDETADLVKAGRDIVNGAGFDNNIVCICEKEILAVASIADELIAEMKKNSAFLLNSEQTERITGMVIADPGRAGHEGMANKEFVGKDAQVIARAASIEVLDQTRILLCEVNRDHPLVWTEQLMPVIPLVRMADCDEAIDFAVECEHGFRHTAVMHSLNIENLSRMARVMNCSLFVKNGSAYNGLGNGGAGFTSFTIASPTGEGFTRARTFTRERRCALIDYFRIV